MKQRNRKAAIRRAQCRLTGARRGDRRGVLLLVVLSLLVLFLLFGTTFLITSGQYKTATQVLDKATRTTFQPADVLERALMQLLRDTNNPTSVVRYHSLLRDVYGVDGFIGRPAQAGFGAQYSVRAITEAPAPIQQPHFAGVTPANVTTQPLGPTQGQLVEFYVYDDPTFGRLDRNDRNTVGLDFGPDGLPVDHQLPSADGYYNGCVLTFVTGPCRGSSVRVVDYDHVQAGTASDGTAVPVGRLRITAPRRADGRPLRVESGVITDLVDTVTVSNTTTTHGHRFIVNGRPFNGAGVGFNPLALSHDLDQRAPSPRLSAAELFVDSSETHHYGMEHALTPNSVQYFEAANVVLNPRSGNDPWGKPFGRDDYVRLDFPPLSRGFVPSSDTNNYNATTNPLYRTFAGPGDTDESYDAPDTQNMALALQSPEPRLRGRVVNAAGQSVDPDNYYPANGGAPAPAYLDLDGVTIPSFHRPALANFWFHRLINSTWLVQLLGNDPSARARAVLEPYGANGQPQFGLTEADARTLIGVKRKFLLRPLREDHPDFDGSNALSRYGTTALRAALSNGALVNNDTDEITFPFWEAVGPWDVDNDADGVPDSVWVDVGLPVQKTEDGRWYKPLVAMLVEDLDGRLNLNAHGSTADLVEAFGPSLANPVVAGQPVEGQFDTSLRLNDTGGIEPWRANLAQDYSNQQGLFTSDQLPTGLGVGPAEVSLRSILALTLPGADLNGGLLGYVGDPAFDDYARLLAGRATPAVALDASLSVLAVTEPVGRYGSYPSDLTLGAINGVQLYQPGRSYVAQAIDDSADFLPPVARESIRDATTEPRSPFERVGSPAYVTSDNQPDVGVDLRSGFSSPPDEKGRYARGLTIAGTAAAEAVYAVNAQDPTLTWRQDFRNTPNDSPYELDLSIAAGRLPPVSLEAIRRSYDLNNDRVIDATPAPLNDDAPFSAAELERLLRAFDADALALPGRLWNLVDAFDPIKLAAATRLEAQIRANASDPPSATSLGGITAAAKASINRRSVTTDSWDLPVPNESWGERLALGADGLPGVPWNDTNLSGFRDKRNAPTADAAFANLDDVGDDDNDGLFDEGDEAIVGFNPGPDGRHYYIDADGNRVEGPTYDALQAAGCDDYVVVMRRDPPASPRLIDYLRYRVTLELLRKGVVDGTTPLPIVDRHVDEILLGGDPRPTTYTRQRTTTADGIDGLGKAGANMSARLPLFSYGGLVAQELLAGHRMNLNRPLGDGRDNGDGVDNDGNGLIDDPAEMRTQGTPESDFVLGQTFANPYDRLLNGVVDEPGEAGEPWVDLDRNGQVDFGEYLDYNANGFYDPPRDVLWATDLNGDGSYLLDPGVPFGNAGAAYDPAEVTPFNYTAGADANGRGSYVAAAGTSLYTSGAGRILDDGPQARQLLARHLYCLMLALMDENYVVPHDPNDLQTIEYLNPELLGSVAFQLALDLYDQQFRALIADDSINGFAGTQLAQNGALLLGTRPHLVPLNDPGLEGQRQRLLADARSEAQRKLTRRMIAQWAINVVDFRDPDAIQTPFEYDENPWDGWNVVDTIGLIDPANRVYPLDGDLSTDETRGQFRDVQLPDLPVVPDSLATRFGLLPTVRFLDQTRGVVWGAERPELLLTEGLAWHDRRAVDTDIRLVPPDSGQDPAPEEWDGGVIASDGDDDLDQVIRPKGFAYIEAYNPWIGDPQRPAEFYSYIDQDVDDDTGTNANLIWEVRRKLEGGLRLDRLSDEQYAWDSFAGPIRSPVWRLAVVEEDPRLRNATLDAPGTAAGGAGAGGGQAVPQRLGGDPEAFREAQNAGAGGPLWLSDDPYPGANVLVPTPNRTQAGPWQHMPYTWDNTGFGDREPLANFNTQRSRAAEVVLTRGELSQAFDADGLAIALGLREAAPNTPDTAFPGFDRFDLPEPTGFGTVPIRSFLDDDDGEITRRTFEKPRRYIERAIYAVTPYAASDPRMNQSGSANSDQYGIPIARVNPLDSPLYDAAGYRVPVNELVVGLPSGNEWTEEIVSNFNGRRIGDTVAFNTNRYAAFDWFDLDGDDQRFWETNAVGNPELQHIEAVEIAPLLPGRRAIIGTQGTVYQQSITPSLTGSPDDEIDGLTRGSFVGDPDDERGPRTLFGRFTTLTAPDLGTFVEPATRTYRFGRIEMIPSPEETEHQVAVRMNGLTESTTVYRHPNGDTVVGQNMTVAPAAPTDVDTGYYIGTGPPVVAVPIDNFSISEPIDQYLLRAYELDSGNTVAVEFERRGTNPVNQPAGTPFAYAEGYFIQANNGVSGQLGFDEPFDVLPELVRSQTTPNYRSVHLERLANPLLAWNPAPYDRAPLSVPLSEQGTNAAQTYFPTPLHDPTRPINPYLPVDSLPMDLTALNTLGEEDQADTTRANGTRSDYVRDVSDAEGGPEVSHREPRAIPAEDGGTSQAAETRNPFAPRSVERDRPWGAFRSLWTATVGRLLWRQSRPTTTSELVVGTDRLLAGGTGDVHIATMTQADKPPTASEEREPGFLGGTAPPPQPVGNGYDFTAEYELLNMNDTLDQAIEGRVYQLGWRMTLGFASPWSGQHFVGSGLGWRGPRIDNPIPNEFPQNVDLDGDRGVTDLIGFGALGELANAFIDGNANGRPDLLENINWGSRPNELVDYDQDNANDLDDDRVVDAHEAAQNPLRDQSTTPELHWPNRPFVNAGELLQVPVWGGSRMLTHFSAFNWLHTQGPEFWHHTQVNPYNGEAAIKHDGLDYTNELVANPTATSPLGPNDLNGNFADEASPDRRDIDPYLDMRATNELRFRETLGHFGHLANFFQTARHPAFLQQSQELRLQPGGLNTGTPPPAFIDTQVARGASHFYRILDYVHVPTPFTGQNTLLNPEVFGEENLAPNDVRSELAAPFNTINGYREPGRVNLNTVVGRRDPAEPLDWWSEVYDGLMHRTQDTSFFDFDNGTLEKMGHLGPAWRDVALSRRGYVQSNFDPTVDPAFDPLAATDDTVGPGSVSENRLDYSPRRLNPDFPTFFANPFRAPGEGANVPLAHMVQTGVDATVLRAHPLSPGADGAWGRRGVDELTVDKGGDPLAVDADLIHDDASEAGFLTPPYDPVSAPQPPAMPATLELGGGGTSVVEPDQSRFDRLHADVVLSRFRHTRQELGDGLTPAQLGRRGGLPDTLLQDALRPNLAHFFNPRDVSPSQSSNPASLPAIADLVNPSQAARDVDPAVVPGNYETPTTQVFNTEIGRRVTPVPLFSGAALEPSIDTERNATKRFEPIQRMSGLATTRSNVYAVWITVGFFEVKPAAEDPRLWPRYMTDEDNDGIGDTFLPGPPADPNQIEDLFFKVYPEGWTLGKEIGLDTGTNERHRGFYVVDRSRPVAFRPGEDANVSDTVLVRRRIE